MDSLLKQNKEQLLLQKEVIEYLRIAPSSFFSSDRYTWLRSRALKDGSRRKYRTSDVLKFIDLLQKGGTHE